MILIFSQHLEESTNEVMDYLAINSDIKVIRINCEDFINETLRISPADESFVLRGEQIDYQDIQVVWFRRWYDYDFMLSPFQGYKEKDRSFYEDIKSFLIDEANVLFKFLCFKLRSAYWLSRPEDNNINKLVVLDRAAQIGLNIPSTVATNLKSELNAKTNLITKAVGDAGSYNFKDSEFTFYTEEVDLNKTPDTFFPSLFQEKVEKEFEIRSFYLDGDFYSVAIFSQRNEQTKVDFRHYDNDTPNYNTAFQLPENIESSLKELMMSMNLETGSIDLIKSMDSEYYFLEVNPIGQFGATSMSGNFHLEKKVALFLIQKHMQS